MAEKTNKHIYDSINTKCLHPYLGVFPCRSCVNCLSARAKFWTSRIMAEYERASQTFAFCLTYTDDLIFNPFSTSESLHWVTHQDDKYRIKYVPCLSKRDIQNFLKRLRKRLYKYDKEITLRYFVKGEYGDINFRPHYHIIFFLSDYVKDFENMVCQSWFNGILKYHWEDFPDMTLDINQNKVVGVNPFVEIEDFNEELAHYSAKYTAKETILKECEGSSIVPEFSLSSQHFGVREEDFYQVADMRKRYIDICRNSENMTDADFVKEFESATTYFRDGKPVFLPTYLRYLFFGGYYRYLPPLKHLKNVHPWADRNKKWSGSKENQIYRDKWGDLMERYLNIKASNYFAQFGINYLAQKDDVCENNYLLQKEYNENLKRIEQSQNRTNGILLKRYKAMARRKATKPIDFYKYMSNFYLQSYEEIQENAKRYGKVFQYRFSQRVPNERDSSERYCISNERQGDGVPF
jgi:hypothetical protein